MCPDPKGMVFIHFYGIWGHLDGLQQRYLVKKPKVENLGLVNFWITGLPQTKRCKNLWVLDFSIHPDISGGYGKMPKNQVIL